VRLALALATALLLEGCVGQARVVELRSGEKLVSASWRDSSLWLLTRAARVGESPEEYLFRESSSLGWLEATVTVRER
jgi:hypothetical protein